MTWRAVLAAGVLVLVLAVAVAGCDSTAPTPSPAEVTAPAGSSSAAAAAPAALPTVLILDGSGSMQETDAPGPRIAAAQEAATTLVESLPAGSRLGLMTYGTGTGNSPAEQAAGCRDVTTLLPVDVIDPAATSAQIAGLTPRGYTPIGAALTRAAAQLPVDEPAAVVLVSDGEDTCAPPPPCDVAADIHSTHPQLAISTVGFKTSSEQLSCIAETTGGVYVTAANTAQLTARLLATQDPVTAKASLTSTGLLGVTLGQTVEEIVAAHPDFPTLASGSRNGDRVVVVWRDCEWVFDSTSTLDSIRPRTGRTVDGLTVGQPLDRATELYGEAVATSSSDGTGTAVFTADATAGTAYSIGFRGDASTGTITTIVLCRCLPEPAVTPTPTPAPSGAGATRQVVLTPVDASGRVQPGWSVGSPRPGAVDCYGPGEGSDDPRTLTCGATADSLSTCFPTGPSSAVCADGPFARTLTPVTTSSSRPASGGRSGDVLPAGITLADGSQCLVRHGSGNRPSNGASADYTDTYSCAGTGRVVWATYDTGFGRTFDKTRPAWTVEYGDGSGPSGTQTVTEAYFFGTA